MAGGNPAIDRPGHLPPGRRAEKKVLAGEDRRSYFLCFVTFFLPQLLLSIVVMDVLKEVTGGALGLSLNQGVSRCSIYL